MNDEDLELRKRLLEIRKQEVKITYLIFVTVALASILGLVWVLGAIIVTSTSY